jgi:hypothetical protein
MKAPNPELVAGLDVCRTIPPSPQKEWDDLMSSCATQIQLDRYDIRGTSYHRNTFTVAALLATNQRLREMVVKAGGNLKQFDLIIGQAQTLMLEQVSEQAPAVKIANVLNKLTGQSY